MEERTAGALKTPPMNWSALQTDIRPYHAQLGRAADTVVDQEVSNYPIFFAFAGGESEKAPGIHVMDVPTDREVVWTLHLTTLEELVTKRIITQEKIDPFRKLYRQNGDQFCFLIVDEEGARFGFVPRLTAPTNHEA